MCIIICILHHLITSTDVEKPLLLIKTNLCKAIAGEHVIVFKSYPAHVCPMWNDNEDIVFASILIIIRMQNGPRI